jgi:transcriptional regulator with XRE-family HTH domain
MTTKPKNDRPQPGRYGTEILCALSANVKKARKNLGLTQQDVAQAAEVSPSYISQVESGKRVPSLEVLLRISDILNVSLPQILGYQEILTIQDVLKSPEGKEDLLKDMLHHSVEIAVSKILSEKTS